MNMSRGQKVDHEDIPEKAVKLARRAAGLETTDGAQRVFLELIMLPDGRWYLIVNRGQKMENLGR